MKFESLVVDDVLNNVVEEFAVVRDDDTCAGRVDEVLLKPSYVLDVEMVGWFIEKKDIWIFEDGTAKFVFTPNTPVRQVWISAQSTSFKLEWNEEKHTFTLAKTGEDLRTLTERLLREHLGNPAISLI